MNKLKLALISKFLIFDKNDKSHKGCKLVTLTSRGTILRMNTNKKTEGVMSSDLFNRITSDTGHVLYGLLPPKHNRALRERGHDFIHLRVKREQINSNGLL